MNILDKEIENIINMLSKYNDYSYPKEMEEETILNFNPNEFDNMLREKIKKDRESLADGFREVFYMNINYNKDKSDELRSRIVSKIKETGMDIRTLANVSKVNYFGLRFYLLGRNDMRAGDVSALCEVLGINFIKK